MADLMGKNDIVLSLIYVEPIFLDESSFKIIYDVLL